MHTLGRPRHRWEDNVKRNLWEMNRKMWIGFTWLRIRTFRFHKRQGIYLLAE
jgi:hypothetical protein